jgi:hypothetical protein
MRNSRLGSQGGKGVEGDTSFAALIAICREGISVAGSVRNPDLSYGNSSSTHDQSGISLYTWTKAVRCVSLMVEGSQRLRDAGFSGFVPEQGFVLARSRPAQVKLEQLARSPRTRLFSHYPMALEVRRV